MKTFNQHTLLLADDNQDDLCIMKTAFVQAGVPNELQTVLDGEQAIAYLKGDGEYSDRQRYPFPIVVFLDLNMPKKGGLEVLAWIREQPALKTLTVLILTASNRRTDVGRAYELGANSYLIKPGRFQELVELLKAWHRLSQSAAFPMIQQAVEV